MQIDSPLSSEQKTVRQDCIPHKESRKEQISQNKLHTKLDPNKDELKAGRYQ